MTLAFAGMGREGCHSPARRKVGSEGVTRNHAHGIVVVGSSDAVEQTRRRAASLQSLFGNGATPGVEAQPLERLFKPGVGWRLGAPADSQEARVGSRGMKQPNGGRGVA
jgi:hypothetical protein